MFFPSFFLGGACRGNFELTYQRRVGANTDPDFFEFAFSSKHFPVRFAWRWKEKRRALSSEFPKNVAEDLPYLPLWFNDVVSVHRALSAPLILPPAATVSSLAVWHRNAVDFHRVARSRRYRSLSPRGERGIYLCLLCG